MAITHPHTVRCSCGETFTAYLADAVNVQRRPATRDEILAGTFHRTRCRACGRETTIEKEFSYVDFARGSLYRVKPRQERDRWQADSAALETDADKVPDALAPRAKRTLRVIYGLSELREKLLVENARLDDRMLEVLKALVLRDHPFLLQRPRLRMALTDLSDKAFTFTASFDHGAEAFRLALPRRVIDDVKRREVEVRRAVDGAHPRARLFDLDRDHWVNHWRWSPQTWALAELRRVADALRAGRPPDPKSRDFRAMLRGLPRGKNLPRDAKQRLGELQAWAQRAKQQRLQDQLFELRFGIALDDDWALNRDERDISILWNVLSALPDLNVEGNVALDALELAPGEGGGWYEPWSHDIYIGSTELASREGLEDVLRHEVGHAVHERFTKKVDAWLRDEFGWESFPATADGIDAWVKRMGGWGSLDAGERREVRDALVTALGPGSRWRPGPEPRLPAGHPWHRADFGPRLAYERTGEDWFTRCGEWYTRGGKAFFLNYYYATFTVVDAATITLIKKMPSRYAAMSPFEFFAELYALYYDLDDPKRPVIPKRVTKWLDENIGVAEQGDLAPAHRSGGTRRRRPAGPPRRKRPTEPTRSRPTRSKGPGRATAARRAKRTQRSGR